jgi:synaptojanin
MAAAPYQVLLRDHGGRGGARTLVLRRTLRGVAALAAADEVAVVWEGTQVSTPLARTVDDKGLYPLLGVYGCVGVLSVRREVFAGFVTDVAPVGSLDAHTVYRITGVRFVALTTNTYDNAADRGEYTDPATGQAAAHPCADAQRYWTAGMFYFAPFVDLTSNTQRRALVAAGVVAAAAAPHDLLPRSPWATVDLRYLWNRYMLKDLLRILPRAPPSEDATWPPLVLAVQGFFASEAIAVAGQRPSSSSSSSGTRVQVALISRVSAARTGTRYNVRGIDDDGHCANFVETEQLVVGPDGTCLAYTQVRGSVPLFWEQDGVQLGGQRIDFSRHAQAGLPALRRHMDDLLLRYGPVRAVTLLAHRGAEQALGDAYRRAVSALADPAVRLTAFDFHDKCRDSLDNVSLLVAELTRDLRAIGCFERAASGNVLARQEGIIRTNCLDCLDRCDSADRTRPHTVRGGGV